jgi:DNA-binding NarL/FixJ family response regulator
MSWPKLVLADDDAPLARELAEFLSEVGYEVAGIASDGNGCIELVERTNPDLVLMDVRMKPMSGTEAAGILHDQRPGLPVILLSAYGDESIIKAARDAEVAAYLVKGCSASELLETMSTAVSGARSGGWPE